MAIAISSFEQVVKQSLGKKNQNNHNNNNQRQLHRMVSTLVAFVIVTIIAQSIIVPTPVAARYLPTRSNVDQLRRQEIKEMLRLLLDVPRAADEPQQQQQQAREGIWLNRNMADMYELDPVMRASRHSTIGGDLSLATNTGGSSGGGGNLLDAGADRRSKRSA